MLIYTFIFSFLFRIPVSPGEPSGLNIYSLWLLCGLLPWLFFAKVLNQGTGIYIHNSSLIQKVYFPRAILPLSMVGVIGYNWLFEMGVLLIALLICGANVLPWLPLVIVFMVLLSMFSAGVALMFSIANVMFRDIEHAISVFTQIWLYLTPVIYPVSLVQVKSEELGGLFGTNITLLGLYELNPLTSFITVFRDLLYDNKFPAISAIIASFIWGVGAFLIGLAINSRYEKKLAELI